MPPLAPTCTEARGAVGQSTRPPTATAALTPATIVATLPSRAAVVGAEVVAAAARDGRHRGAVVVVGDCRLFVRARGRVGARALHRRTLRQLRPARAGL